MLRAVLDTNVLVAGLRSRRGASGIILDLVESRLLQPVVSVPLMFEYEEVLKRPGTVPGFSEADVDRLLDAWVPLALCVPRPLRRRPFLPDPDDDMLVELALTVAVPYLVSANVRHLAPARRLGLGVLTPGQFLGHLATLP